MNKSAATKIASKLHKAGHYGITICQSYPSDGTYYIKSVNPCGVDRIYHQQSDALMDLD